jgi:hypothetical protein
MPKRKLDSSSDSGSDFGSVDVDVNVDVEVEVEGILTLDEYEYILQYLQCYWEDNPNAIAYPDWYKKLLKEWVAPVLGRTEEQLSYVLEDLISSGLFIPHAYSTSFVREDVMTLEERIQLDDKIDNLYLQPQPEQRTPEWYEFRNNLITASNAYKAFGTISAKNSLIYEKCSPISAPVEEDGRGFLIKVNMEDARHKGQKYEPISCQLYEYFYETKIGEFGCLVHPRYAFLGASPDGINIDPMNKRFGRMLEIKNVQTITENPKIEYWTQTQLQMEVCDLNECDFLETRFEEISPTEYAQYRIQDVENHVLRDWERGEQGDIHVLEGMTGMYLAFLENGWPKYVYRPLMCADGDDTSLWIHQQMRQSARKKWEFYNIYYWRLSGVGCVMVPRNQKWFREHVDQLSELWKLILEERQTGSYALRAPKKRPSKAPVCLIKW